MNTFRLSKAPLIAFLLTFPSHNSADALNDYYDAVEQRLEAPDPLVRAGAFDERTLARIAPHSHDRRLGELVFVALADENESVQLMGLKMLAYSAASLQGSERDAVFVIQEERVQTMLTSLGHTSEPEVATAAMNLCLFFCSDRTAAWTLAAEVVEDTAGSPALAPHLAGLLTFEEIPSGMKIALRKVVDEGDAKAALSALNVLRQRAEIEGIATDRLMELATFPDSFAHPAALQALQERAAELAPYRDEVAAMKTMLVASRDPAASSLVVNYTYDISLRMLDQLIASIPKIE